MVGYGAPGKGNTLLNHCGVRADLLAYTVDRNPHKQGMFLPGTHIPIHPPERIAADRPDYVLVLPWNLRTEIYRAAVLRPRLGRPARLPDPSTGGGLTVKVVLFCGGLGMRMREGAGSAPKPMTMIGDRPLLWHVMRYYAHFGHTDFILCLGYGAARGQGVLPALRRDAVQRLHPRRRRPRRPAAQHRHHRLEHHVHRHRPERHHR